MRTPASFAALVTLMAVAGTTAAPVETRPNPSNVIPVPIPGHRRSHGAVPFVPVMPSAPIPAPVPAPGSKLVDRTIPIVNGCDCEPGSIGNVKTVAADAGGKAMDMGKTVQDKLHAPDAGAHVDFDVNNGGEKTTPSPHPEPQQPPQPQPQPQPAPEPHPEPLPLPHPQSLPQPVNSRVDPGKTHGGPQANACMTVNPEGGKQGLGAAHHDVHNVGDEIKAKAHGTPDHVHHVQDEATNISHDIEKGAQITKVDVDSDAIGGEHKPTPGGMAGVEGATGGACVDLCA